MHEVRAQRYAGTSERKVVLHQMRQGSEATIFRGDVRSAGA